MQGYTDGTIYTHVHTLQYNAHFIAACDDKKAGLFNLSYIQFRFPPHYFGGYPVSRNNTYLA